LAIAVSAYAQTQNNNKGATIQKTGLWLLRADITNTDLSASTALRNWTLDAEPESHEPLTEQDSAIGTVRAGAGQNAHQSDGNVPGDAQKQALANSWQAPSFEDLGLSRSQTQGNPQLQARLDKRSHMLKIHQRLGLIATVLLIATVATGFGAGGRSTSSSDRRAHDAPGNV